MTFHGTIDWKIFDELRVFIIHVIVMYFLPFLPLPQRINEKLSVVSEYESGKAIPNQQIIAKMERVLG